jgi:hypothetical protein
MPNFVPIAFQISEEQKQVINKIAASVAPLLGSCDCVLLTLILRKDGDARSHGIRELHCFSTLNAERFYRAAGFNTVGPIDVQLAPSMTFPGILMRCEIA